MLAFLKKILEVEIYQSSDWQDGGTTVIDATTTAPTKGTVGIDSVQYRFDGEDALVRMTLYRPSISGATDGSGDYLYKMPAGLKINTLKTGTYTVVEGGGEWQISNTVGTGAVADGLNTGISSIVVYDEDYVRIAIVYTSGSGGSRGYQSNGSFAMSNTESVTLDFRVPIQGRTATKTIKEILGL